jgi:hypothetical protein
MKTKRCGYIVLNSDTYNLMKICSPFLVLYAETDWRTKMTKLRSSFLQIHVMNALEALTASWPDQTLYDFGATLLLQKLKMVQFPPTYADSTGVCMKLPLKAT